MESRTFFSPPEKKYLSSSGLITYLKEFADITISRSTIYKLTMNGVIPHIKGPGKRLLFPIEGIKQWIENPVAIDKDGE
jgi:excisionase family DNA binding protein